MDFKVVWSPSARSDLKDIVTYIAEDNPSIAEKFGRSLIEASKALGRFEKQGRVVPEFGTEHLRELIHGRYRIIYRVKKDDTLLEIVRLWHGARGTPKL
jgi:plasmid stabilization system protein ParE